MNELFFKGNYIFVATDLAKYMRNRFEYFYTLSHFDATNRQHRKHLSAILMTTADLCDNTKTWDANLPTVVNYFILLQIHKFNCKAFLEK